MMQEMKSVLMSSRSGELLLAVDIVNVFLFSNTGRFRGGLYTAESWVCGQLQEELLSGLWFVAVAEDFFPFSKCSGV